MKTRTLLLSGAGLLVAVILALLLAGWLRRDTTMELQVRDSVSGRWVWNASLSLQNRLIAAFYQSDNGLQTFHFTHLQPGPSTLDVTAPGYEPIQVPVLVKRGTNRLAAPLTMVSLGIPDLAEFFVFEKIDSGDIVGELRPVSTTGGALINHPCVDLWVGCQVSVQLKGGVPVREETPSGSTRGTELYRGEVPWTWDPSPEKQFRYSVRIPGPQIKRDPSPFRVIDYLIVEPDPRRISRQQLGELMARIYPLRDPARITAELDKEKGRLRYFIDTSWNVPSP
jgi:hypothetical protein